MTEKNPKIQKSDSKTGVITKSDIILSFSGVKRSCENLRSKSSRSADNIVNNQELDIYLKVNWKSGSKNVKKFYRLTLREYQEIRLVLLRDLISGYEVLVSKPSGETFSSFPFDLGMFTYGLTEKFSN